MKLNALFLALAVAGACASFALADDGHKKASDTTSTATTTTSETPKCPRAELAGTLASVSTGSFTMTVKRANDGMQSLVGQTATVTVDAKTRVSWDGFGTFTGPNVGDVVVVHARQCGGATGAITARSVKAHTPHADNAAEHDAAKK